MSTAEAPLPAEAPAAASIADYALIGDGRTAALVSRDGSVDWLCLPNLAGPAIFARLLDPEGGYCSIRPAGPFRIRRRYLADSAVLETEFETGSGTLRIRDAVPVQDGIAPMRPQHELLRIVECVRGEVAMEAALHPRPNYARTRASLQARGVLGWTFSWGNELLLARSSFRYTPDNGGLHASLRMERGQRHYLSLSYTCGDPCTHPLLGGDADGRVRETTKWWRQWAESWHYSGPFADAVRRSALTLRLLAYPTSGAIVAAPTTSLPETPGGDRNWDYRFCWLRDAGLTVQALTGSGCYDIARAYLDWLLHATRLTWPELRVVYDLYGRSDLAEEELPHFRGFRDSRPVRVGNGAYTQSQLDVYGEVVQAAFTVVCAGGTLGRSEARMLIGLGRTVCKRWQEPDRGIWEMRSGPRQFTYSKLMCWVALDRLLKLHERGALDLGRCVYDFAHGRTAICEAIEQRGYNRELNAYTSELDGSLAGAGLLQLALTGFKDPNDARMRSTYDFLSERLEKNGLWWRYEPGYDGMASPEGAFGICSFWNVQYLAERGDVAEAERQCERLLSYANDLGLFAEEIDGETGEPLGNFPQAFTHVGLINAALSLARAKEA